MSAHVAVNTANQLAIFGGQPEACNLDARLWRGCFNGRECSLQQLSPYVGKMKSGMARVLVHLYSNPGDIVLDPFAGSGVVSLEAVLSERIAYANDLSPYAYALIRGKLEAPDILSEALERASSLLSYVEKVAPDISLEDVPKWIREFFHEDTLREIVAAFDMLKSNEDFFLIACLLGILHHVRPGFLSYPASHLVPYLRRSKYPPEEHPRMYAYRDLRSRLLAKVRRAYRIPPNQWRHRQYQIWQTNAMNLPLPEESVDAIISSPPYFGALDYARDNRLRLWFLGCREWKNLDKALTANAKVYLPQMRLCLKEMHRVLKKSSPCVLVLGDVEHDGKTRRTAEILAEAGVSASDGGFTVDTIYDDVIPDERRARRRTQTTKFDRILVMHKRS